MKEDLSIMLGKERFNFRVGALIEYDGKVLLQKNDNLDFYNLPGGRVKIGESTLEAVKREIKEELDVEESNFELSHVLENFFTFDSKVTHELFFIYKLQLKKGHPLTSKNKISALDREEERNYWIKKEDTDNLKCMPIALHEVINKISNVITTSVEKD